MKKGYFHIKTKCHDAVRKINYWHAVSVSTFIFLWYAATAGGMIPAYKFPGPEKVMLALWELITEGLPPGYFLWGHIMHSIFRVWLGFTVAGLSALCLGIIMGLFPPVKVILTPFIEFLRPIPPIAWIPIAILWFGIGNPSAVFVIGIGAFFPVLLNTVVGVENVEQKYLDAALTLGSTKWDLVRRVLLPGAAPVILTGLRLGWQIGWMTLVAAEFTGVRSGYGLGYLISIARDIQRPAMVIAGMVVIGVIGYLSNYIFDVWRVRRIRW